MKIAVYINTEEQVAALHETGRVRLYENEAGRWNSTGELPFRLAADMSLAEIQAEVGALGAHLKGCRVFLSAGTRGLPYAILQEAFGLRAWQSQGTLFEQLDFVARKEEAHTARETADAACAAASCRGACRPNAAPTVPPTVNVVTVAPEHYRIDLIAALKNDGGANSRQVLLPFLRETPFRRLDIVCDHLPRWFDATLDELGLEVLAQGPSPADATLRVSVVPKH